MTKLQVARGATDPPARTRRAPGLAAISALSGGRQSSALYHPRCLWHETVVEIFVVVIAVEIVTFRSLLLPG